MTFFSTWAARLPRETRDSLFLLLILSALALQMARALPLWAGGFALALLAWRTTLAWRAKPLPKRWLRISLLALSLGGVLFELISQASVSGAALTFLLTLLALKTLEMHTQRDSMVLFFLAFFCIVTNFLFNQSLPVALLMVLLFWGLLTALVNAHKPVGKPPLKESAFTAVKLLLIGLPLIATLYALFPRFPPLWGIPNAPGQGQTGLSDSMEVGAISQLAQNRDVALRVEFAPGSPIPTQSQMYFRGPVLGHLQGRHWRAFDPLPVQPDAPAGSAYNPQERQGPAVRYTTVLEPHRLRWLLPLELGAGEGQNDGIDLPRSMLSQELVWSSHRPLQSATRYQGISYPQSRQGRHMRPRELARYLRLPGGDNPRTRAWAQELRTQFAHLPKPEADRALIGHTLKWLREQEFHYTLRPPLYGEHTADEFWFTHRRGFCEHIASAYAILMRAADIPARIVTGYQGGEANPVNGVWTVRQSDAHAWVELWLPGHGWQRIDPTGAIAPERIELAQSQVPEGNDVRAAAFGAGWSWMMRLSALQDAIDYRWTQWVINYDQKSQQSLLESLGLRRLNWQQIALTAVGLTLATGLAYLIWPLLRQRRRDPWLHLLAQTRSKLAAAGLELPEHTPPARMAQACEQFFGPGATDLAQWLQDMHTLRYARQAPLTLPELARRWRRLSWPQHPHS